MSVGQLLQPNSYNIFVKSLNGITTEDITGTNENGQVLTIVDKLEKKVAFVDAPSGVPDTVGFPDGYVLKIVDNTQNEVSWEPDIGGGAAVPFILTGDSVNALKVQTTGLEPIIRADTVDKEVHLSGIRNMVEGSDDEKKFSVFNSSDPVVPVYNLSTDPTAQPVSIAGNPQPFNVPTYSMIKAPTPSNDFIGYICKNGAGEFYLLNSNQGSGTNGMYFNGANTQLTNFNGIMTINGQAETYLQREGAFGSPKQLVALKETGINIESTDPSVGSGAVQLTSKDTSGNPRAELRLQTSGGPGEYGIFTFSSQSGLDFTNLTLNNNSLDSIWNSSKTIRHKSDDRLILGDTTTPQVDINGVNLLTLTSTFGDIDITANNTVDIQTNGGKLTLNSLSNAIDILSPNGLTKLMNDSILIDSATAITLNTGGDITIFGAIAIPATATMTIFEPPVNNLDVTNKLYVDNKVGYLYSAIGDSTTRTGVSGSILNGTASSGSTLTVPAGSFVAGVSYSLVMAGTCNFSGGNILTIDLRNNTGSLGVLTLTTVSTVGNVNFEIEVDFIIRSTGPSGSIASSFEFTYNVGTSFEGARKLTINSINTNASNTLDVHAGFDAGTNSITTNMAFLKRMH